MASAVNRSITSWYDIWSLNCLKSSIPLWNPNVCYRVHKSRHWILSWAVSLQPINSQPFSAVGLSLRTFCISITKEVKVNLPRCLTKHYTLKYGGVDVYIHDFLTLPLDEGWVVSFTPWPLCLLPAAKDVRASKPVWTICRSENSWPNRKSNSTPRSSSL
jgi:hypothetical protein